MVRVVVRLIIDGKIDIGFPRKKQQRRPLQESRRDQDEDEQQEPPRLLVAPSVEDPPGDHQVQEQINDPDGMDPVNPSMGAGLEHFAYAAQNASHAQGEND